MKIKTIRNTVVHGAVVLAGKTIEVSRSDGAKLISLGKAVAVKSGKKETAAK